MGLKVNLLLHLQITLEGGDPSFVDAAILDLRDTMMPVNYDPSPAENAYEKIQNFLNSLEDEKLIDVIQKSLEVTEECFTKYGQGSVSVCFNGGKECITQCCAVALADNIHIIFASILLGPKLSDSASLSNIP